MMGSDCGTLTWVHGHHQTQWPKPRDQWAQVLGASTPCPSNHGGGLKYFF